MTSEIDRIDKELLDEISNFDNIPKGAYNIRKNGKICSLSHSFWWKVLWYEWRHSGTFKSREYFRLSGNSSGIIWEILKTKELQRMKNSFIRVLFLRNPKWHNTNL